MAKSFITARQAAEIAQVTQPTISNWLRRYRHLGVRVGGRLRVDPIQLDRFLRGELPEQREHA